MSTSEAHKDLAGFHALEGAVSRALERIRGLEDDLARTRARKDEVEALLQRMNTGEESPARMAQKLEALRAENEELRSRVTQGQGVAERLLARVRYLEDHG